MKWPPLVSARPNPDGLSSQIYRALRGGPGFLVLTFLLSKSLSRPCERAGVYAHEDHKGISEENHSGSTEIPRPSAGGVLARAQRRVRLNSKAREGQYPPLLLTIRPCGRALQPCTLRALKNGQLVLCWKNRPLIKTRVTLGHHSILFDLKIPSFRLESGFSSYFVLRRKRQDFAGDLKQSISSGFPLETHWKSSYFDNKIAAKKKGKQVYAEGVYPGRVQNIVTNPLLQQCRSLLGFTKVDIFHKNRSLKVKTAHTRWVDLNLYFSGANIIPVQAKPMFLRRERIIQDPNLSGV